MLSISPRGKYFSFSPNISFGKGFPLLEDFRRHKGSLNLLDAFLGGNGAFFLVLSIFQNQNTEIQFTIQ
jgi:hypothetical protein